MSCLIHIALSTLLAHFLFACMFAQSLKMKIDIRGTADSLQNATSHIQANGLDLGDAFGLLYLQAFPTTTTTTATTPTKSAVLPLLRRLDLFSNPTVWIWTQDTLDSSNRTGLCYLGNQGCSSEQRSWRTSDNSDYPIQGVLGKYSTQVDRSFQLSRFGPEG